MIAFCSMLLSSYSSKTILPNSVRTYIQDICKNFEFEKGSRDCNKNNKETSSHAAQTSQKY